MRSRKPRKKKEQLKQKRENYKVSYESVKRWRNGVCAETSGSLKTEMKHLNFLIKFCEFVRMNPDEIICSRIEDSKSSDPIIRKGWEDKVKAFARKLREESGYYVAREAITSLKSFFMHNYVPLSMKSPRIKDPETYTPSKEEIGKLYQIAKPGWERARISFMYQSGIRPGSIPFLKYKHIKKDFEADIIPVHIHLSKEEVKGKYFGYDTFIGKQAVEDYRLYLELRRRGTDKIPPEIIKDDSPLFRMENTRIIKPLTGIALTSWFVTLSKRAGLEKKITPQALRRATETTLEECNVMPQNWIDHIMGHRPRGAQGKHYSKPSVEKLREAYAKAEPYLTLHVSTVVVGKIRNVSELRTRTDHTISPSKPFNKLTPEQIRYLYEKNKQVQRNLDYYFNSTTQLEHFINHSYQSKTVKNENRTGKKPPLEAHLKNSKNETLLHFFQPEESLCPARLEVKSFEVKLTKNREELVRLLEDGWDLVGVFPNGEFVVRRKNINGKTPSYQNISNLYKNDEVATAQTFR
jgi:integrase